MSTGRMELSNQPSRFLQVHQNVIKYIGKGAHANDVGCVRSNSPFPADLLIGYFEIFVEESSQKASIGIGLSTGDSQLVKLPGYEPNSYGYVGDEGRKYFDRGRESEYGPSFTQGDYVGCGMHFGTQEIFFTKNSQYLGVAFQKVPLMAYYPTIGLHTPGEKVSVNFGSKPFKFDLDNFIEGEKKKVLDSVLATSFEFSSVGELVSEYLLHCGFEDTFRSFSSVPQVENPSAKHSLSTLSFRKKIRTLVLSGNISTAISMIQDQFPDILSLKTDFSSKLLFSCSCQQFIELIRKGEVDNCLSFMQQNLSIFFRDSSKFDQTILQDVVALLAYPNPSDSPLAHLLGDEERRRVADSLNHALLNHHSPAPISESTKLENLLKQLIVVKGFSRSDSFLALPGSHLEPEIKDVSSILFNDPSSSSDPSRSSDMIF